MAEQDDPSSHENDLFALNSIFPEPEQVFSFKLDSLESIRDRCDVALDTNVLLVPYTTSAGSLEQIKTTYRNLVDQRRLIIPGQVAREFAKNRASKISEIVQQLSTKRDSIPPVKKSTYPLLSPLPAFQKHVELEDRINQFLSEYRLSINNILRVISDWTWNDPVSELYRELFSKGVVYDLPLDQNLLTAEFRKRRRQRIPPGFKDKGIGDLIIWKTILDHGKKTNRDVILVSNDVKTDWWYQSDKESLYPRFELVDEFRRETGGHSVHIVTFSKFLDLYGASEAVIEEVRVEEKLAQIDRISSAREPETVHKAVWKWLISTYPESSVIEYSEKFPDFVVVRPDGGRIGVKVRLLGQTVELARRFREIKQTIAEASDVFTSYLIICVGDNLGSAMLMHQRIRKLDITIPNTTIITGTLNSLGAFESLL